MTSFQRQLNLYGFVRLAGFRDHGAYVPLRFFAFAANNLTCFGPFHRYYHELFLRSRPDLCRSMIRTRIKGTGIKASSSPDTEPDFYQMEHCPAPSEKVFAALLSNAKAKRSRESSSQADGESVRRQDNSSTQSLEIPVLRCDGAERARMGISNCRRLKRRISKEYPPENRKSSNGRRESLDIPAFIEMNGVPSIDEMIGIPSMGTEDSSIRSHRSTLNWLDSYFSTETHDANSQSGSTVSTLSAEEDGPSVPPFSPSPEPNININVDIESSLPQLEEPGNGSVAFFEGKSFYYLQHIDIDSLDAALEGEAIRSLHPEGGLVIESHTHPSMSDKSESWCAKDSKQSSSSIQYEGNTEESDTDNGNLGQISPPSEWDLHEFFSD
jgi:hypothetical protein